MYNLYFKISKDDLSLIVRIYESFRYQDDKLIRIFRLDYPSKDEINLALKHWFFGNGTYETHRGVSLRTFKNIPTFHKLWNNMYTLKVSDDLYLSAPNMREFLIKKEGVRPVIDFQLSYHFC